LADRLVGDVRAVGSDRVAGLGDLHAPTFAAAPPRRNGCRPCSLAAHSGS
jgi:hypothetical protein